MKETGRQERPPPVAGGEPEPPQGGDIRARWAWVEASVWTSRMLRALETGMEEGKWFRLIDKVWSEKNLQSALEQVVYKSHQVVAGLGEPGFRKFVHTI